MGQTAYSSANRAYPFLQEESEPSEEEMQGRRDSNPRPTVFRPARKPPLSISKRVGGAVADLSGGLAAAVSVTRGHPGG